MKKTFKFYIALWCAKGTRVILKTLKRNATNLPGNLALKICPDFIGRIDKPKTVIGVTGTNGKTTVCNIIEDILKENGYDFIDNNLGANTKTGIATTLISGANLIGKTKKQIAVLEIDERSAPRVYPYLTPTYLVCTNLFRDSLMRNAHAEFISDILTKNIPKETKLILNSDDLISSNIAPDNDRVYFSISRLETDTEECNNIVRDLIVCPKCNEKIIYDYVRYNHIGKAHCPNCNFGTKEADYIINKIDIDKRKIKVINKGIEEEYNVINTNIINVYNILAVITLLKELGLTKDKIDKGLDKLKIVETRYKEEIIEDKNIKIITHLAKGLNPIACSRAFEFAKRAEGNKIVIVIVDDLFDAAKGSENIAWQYDADYEFLKDESIKQVIVAGARWLDGYVRMRMADIPEEKIIYMKDEVEAVSKINITNNIDKIIILHELYAIEETEKIKNKIKEIIKEKK